MTFLSPFNVRSPVFFMEFFQAGHEIKYFGFRRVATGMIVLGCLYNDINDIRETAAATAALRHGVIHLGGDDELPTVLIEELGDDLPDFLVGDVITATNQHSSLSPSNMTFAVLLSAKEDDLCQEKSIHFSLEQIHEKRAAVSRPELHRTKA
ncbi:hypothetical protein FHX11_004528 [Rhizobium sp. BK602]|nr:hypothetical protein [Rhizobium sp. BK602]